jgi:hypothetical protein
METTEKRPDIQKTIKSSQTIKCVSNQISHRGITTKKLLSIH